MTPTPHPSQAQRVDVLERAEGHCADNAAWLQFSTHPTYAHPTREHLAFGDLSDFDLANRVFLAGRDDLAGYQTAAKERIRWLSVQLAIARALAGVQPK